MLDISVVIYYLALIAPGSGLKHSFCFQKRNKNHVSPARRYQYAKISRINRSQARYWSCENLNLLSDIGYFHISNYFPIPNRLIQASQLCGVLGISLYQAISLYQSSQIKFVSSAVYREFLYIKLFPYARVPKASAATPQERLFCVFKHK